MMPIAPSNVPINHGPNANAASGATAQAMAEEIETPLFCFVSREHLTDPSKEVSSQCAVELHAYSNRSAVQTHTGKTLNYLRAGKDLHSSRVFFPAGAPEVPALRVWQEADRIAEAQGRVVIISSHLLCRLPASHPDAWPDMIERFVREHVLPMQLIVEAVVHTPHDSSPHVHFQISCRKWLPNTTFGAPIYGATSRQTLTKWQRGWIERMMALPAI